MVSRSWGVCLVRPATGSECVSGQEGAGSATRKPALKEARLVIVYGLCDPDARDLFYVGLTQRHWSVRLSQHCSDPASAAHDRIREIRARGAYPFCIVFGRFHTVDEARVFERDLISLIDGPLVNREPRYAFTEGRVMSATSMDSRRVEPADNASYHPFDDGWDTIDTVLGSDLLDRRARRRARRLRERAEWNDD